MKIVIKNDGTIFPVVGLGLNCNQINFEHLPRASSLVAVTIVFLTKKSFFLLIVDKMKKNICLGKTIRFDVAKLYGHAL